MKAEEIVKKYLEFFKERGHAVIPSAPLIPKEDPSTLFITAGMHPLVPFLLGQPHPKGRRLANSQKCLRTPDIEEVGDSRHNTFFEMLGNWSLGDYFKKESLTWSYEFLTKELGIDKNKINVTVFEGDETAPRDEEAASIWRSLGIPDDRIYFLNKKENWWELETGPCGPDSEIFVDTGLPKCGPKCNPSCDCGKYIEVWNNVFMQYNKTKDGKYLPLEQKNVDTGMGLQRVTAMVQGKDNVFDTELFLPYFKIIKQPTSNKSARIIVDHTRAAVFVLGDEFGVVPGKNDQGYVLRRLIRRSVRHCKLLNINPYIIEKISSEVVRMYEQRYSILKKKEEFIRSELKKEVKTFLKTLDKGLTKFEKMIKGKKELSGSDAFLLYQSFGFPIEMTEELADEKKVKVDVKGFKAEFKKHQQLSRKGAEKRFKGGLADASEETTKLHTATHLLGEALRRVLKSDVKQRGSNITPERLRYDFNFDRKLTKEELQKVEDLVNEQIRKGLPVKREKMTFKEAKELGAQAEFEAKYDEEVFVYSAGDFSKEVCGGPHVSNTKELGKFRIKKEKSIAAGVRRIRAILE
jgi:alanyl-tRNA synthetase